MSDLLLPFVLLMEDDAVAFWCFVSLMQRQRARRNFSVDESGIFQQLKQLAQVRWDAASCSMFLSNQVTCCIKVLPQPRVAGQGNAHMVTPVLGSSCEF